MAAYVMCSLSTSTFGAVRACSHLPGCSSFPVKVAAKSTVTGCRSSASQALQTHSGVITQESDNVATVFSDESKGIVCYRSGSGEVTCEGLDEGPSFYPHSAQLSQQILSSTMSLPDIQVPRPFSISTEDVKYICLREFMGSMFCEGRDES